MYESGGEKRPVNCSADVGSFNQVFIHSSNYTLIVVARSDDMLIRCISRVNVFNIPLTIKITTGIVLASLSLSLLGQDGAALAGAFTSPINSSMSLSFIHECFRHVTIVSIPKFSKYFALAKSPTELTSSCLELKRHIMLKRLIYSMNLPAYFLLITYKFDRFTLNAVASTNRLICEFLETWMESLLCSFLGYIFLHSTLFHGFYYPINWRRLVIPGH